MKKIIFKEDSKEISYDKVSSDDGVIVALENGKIFGVVVHETYKGYILKIGKSFRNGWSGHYENLEDLLINLRDNSKNLELYVGELYIK